MILVDQHWIFIYAWPSAMIENNSKYCLDAEKQDSGQ